MIQKEKLAQFYFTQYIEYAKKYKKTSKEGNRTYAERCKVLIRELKMTTSPKVKLVRLEDVHRQINNIAYFAVRHDNKFVIMKLRDILIPELVRLDLLKLQENEKELLTEKFLEYLRTEEPYEICSHTLKAMCEHYADNGVRRQIIDMVPIRPETEFPEVLAMERKFILHIGPTNCGKTYQALERLKTAENGVYLGPLRLLALEVYEKMNDSGIPCTMLTGEECIYQENSRIISSTIEMLDIGQEYDIAVIDEAQMIADAERGHSWTKAILGLRAKEIHVCMSPSAEKVVTHLISLCNDMHVKNIYERKTPLVYEDRPFIFPDDVRQGDALIVFNKRSVLDIAGRLEEEGIHSSVIYGSLPPEIRRRQIHFFNEKKNKVIVSTDAIGMGLNLPVKRIVFLQNMKFDGKEKRLLSTSEIRQIAGRAGRFGIHDAGYVTAMGEDAWKYIRERYAAPEAVINKVSLGFPHVLLDMAEPLDTILNVWKSVEAYEPFEKINIEDILFLYERAYRDRKDIDGFEDKHVLFRMLTCSIDVKNRDIVELWLEYCKTYTADVSVMFPTLSICYDKGLAKYETYYKMLDLYHQFSARMGKVLDDERLSMEREKTENIIMRLLTNKKTDYIEKCRYCGRALPLGYEFRACEDCYDKHRREYPQ